MDAQGEANAETTFEYHEQGDLIWARYEGGTVRLGYLVGIREGSQLEFRYSHVNMSGETANGRCSTTVSLLPDGRIRLEEDWEWESKPGAGTSTVEEVR